MYEYYIRICMYILVRVTYCFAKASTFTRGTVSWGSFMTGTCWLLMLWYSIEFSDDGTNIVSLLNLRSLYGRSILDLPLRLNLSS